MHPNVVAALDNIRNEINQEYGFQDGIPRINMTEYDEALLEKWSYGLNRTYPRYCPTFSRDKVQRIVQSNLEKLQSDAARDPL